MAGNGGVWLIHMVSKTQLSVAADVTGMVGSGIKSAKTNLFPAPQGTSTDIAETFAHIADCG